MDQIEELSTLSADPDCDDEVAVRAAGVDAVYGRLMSVAPR